MTGSGVNHLLTPPPSSLADPDKVYRTGPNEDVSGDPLVPLEKVLDGYKFIQVQGAPPLTGASPSPSHAPAAPVRAS